MTKSSKIQDLEAKLSLVLPIYEKLQQVIAVSFFVGSDESGFKSGGKKGWFWVWQSAIVTYIVDACTHSNAVIEKNFRQLADCLILFFALTV